MQDTPPCGFSLRKLQVYHLQFCGDGFQGITSDAMTVSPSKVLTGVSRASDREISRSESGTDIPCSHLRSSAAHVQLDSKLLLGKSF